LWYHVSVPKVSSPGAIRFDRKLKRETAKLKIKLNGIFANIIRREARMAAELGGFSTLRKAINSTDEDRIMEALMEANLGMMEESATGRLSVHTLDPKLRGVLETKRIHIREYLENARTEVAERVRRSLIEGQEKGLTLRQMTKKLETDMYDTGAFSSARAEVIARTELAQASNAATAVSLEAAGVKKLEWVTVIDDSTRDDHRAMDGRVNEAGQPWVLPDGTRLRFPADPDGPPEHSINCRCSVVPAE
jgi:SPP1 gp7 family putative phage head morphogenesis protein